MLKIGRAASPTPSRAEIDFHIRVSGTSQCFRFLDHVTPILMSYAWVWLGATLPARFSPPSRLLHRELQDQKAYG